MVYTFDGCAWSDSDALMHNILRLCLRNAASGISLYTIHVLDSEQQSNMEVPENVYFEIENVLRMRRLLRFVDDFCIDERTTQNGRRFFAYNSWNILRKRTSKVFNSVPE